MSFHTNGRSQVASASYDASNNTWTLRDRTGMTVFKGDRVQVEEEFGRILPSESREEFVNEMRVGFSNALMISGVVSIMISLAMLAVLQLLTRG